MWIFGRLKDDSGSALIMAIMMLVLLTVIGISALNNTDLELSIAGNEKAHKMAFYFAEGGNEVSKELVEVAIQERGWLDNAADPITLNKVTVTDKNFFLSQIDAVANSIYPDSAANRDATVNFGTGTTGLLFDVNTVLSSGGAVQMIAGYEGKGKGSASGGAWAIYDIRSQHDGLNNSQARVWSQWLHLL
ncbi:MAG: pilus assembly PilX N-terminal domain-containing protein [Desulfuromusa sp.]|nr:pilus assembly PilX N-terminal domain-containing protein [Desulfuromusa sp.]